MDGKLDIYCCTINLIVIHGACVTNLWRRTAALALCFPALSCVRAQSLDSWPSDVLILANFFSSRRRGKERWVAGVRQSDGVCAEACVPEGAIPQPLSGLFG